MNDQNQKIRNNSSSSSGGRKRKRLVGFPRCLAKYREHFTFLRDAKFLEDLENDSVDSDIIDEELSALHQVPISKRERVVKFLQSNPVQILLCVIVLLDAGIVIAQILLDLNSVKEKLHRRDIQLSELVDYIREAHPDRLGGYGGSNVDLILQLLRRSKKENFTSASIAPPSPGNSSPSSLNESLEKTFSAALAGVVLGPSTPVGNMSEAEEEEAAETGADLFDPDQSGRRPPRTDSSGNYDALHDVAHWLHFVSISLLGFLVIEDFIKMIAMGWTFCKHKIEIFDAAIICSSFTIDLVFLNGVSGEEGQKAAAILVVLLLWRIARVVDGIVITVKQRQEFRIRLQKRARRLAERKVETYEEERHTRSKQIEALKDLCSKAGITEADIAACAPRQHGHGTTTLNALSSVAKLSVSMTMLMSSGIYHKPIQMPPAMMAAAAAAAPSAAAADWSASVAEDAETDSRSLSTTMTTPHQRYPPLRIESLPNIPHGGSSTPASERRKAFSSRMRRKRPTGNMAAASVPTVTVVSTGNMAAANMAAASVYPSTTPSASPIFNDCGIKIVIDKSVDPEEEDEEIENAMAIYSNSCLTFGETNDDDDETAASTSQMFLLSEIV